MPLSIIEEAAKQREMDEFELLDVRPFWEVESPPLEVLPAPLQTFVVQAAESLNCPSDFLFAPLLVAAASAIGSSRLAKPKPDWSEPPILWLGVVADPSSGKSPALAKVNDPLLMHQRSLKKKFEGDMEEYKIDYEQWEADKKHNQKPQEPQQELAFVSDATLESLRDVLTIRPRGILFWQDELRGWLESFGQYKGGKGNDRQAWLSLWSANMAAISRRTQNIVLDRPTINLVGGLQPAILDTFHDVRDGLLSRLLLVYPERIKQSYSPDAVVPDKVMEQWRDIYEYLSLLEPQDDGEPVPMAFTPSASRAFTTWMNEIHLPEMEDNMSPELMDCWSKLKGYCVRLSLIFQCLWSPCDASYKDTEISEQAIRHAIRTVGYFKSHLRKAYGALEEDKDQPLIQTLIDWVKTNKPDGATVREIQLARILPSSRNKASEIESLFKDAEDRGMAHLEKTKRGSLRIVIL